MELTSDDIIYIDSPTIDILYIKLTLEKYIIYIVKMFDKV